MVESRWVRFGLRVATWIVLSFLTLITTLVRLGRDEPAAVLYGAMLASPTAAPVYGADADRLADAMRTMERRADDERVAAWIEQGRGLKADAVVELARTVAMA